MVVSKKTPFYIAALFLVMLSVLLIGRQKQEVRLLYATEGSSYDSSAYDNFRQALSANLQVEQKPLAGLTLRALKRYDAVYLDPGLQGKADLQSAPLQKYVEQGGHLFLENGFAADFPKELLGAKELVKLPNETLKTLKLEFPEAPVNVRGLQEIVRRFGENFEKHGASNDMPDFQWGYGVIPSTAAPIVTRNQVALYTINRYGAGTVLLTGTFLPNRYFITGYDLRSGMDPAQGMGALIAKHNSGIQKVQGAAYFDRTQIPLEPFFHFAFAAANSVFRDEYASFVSKEKWGYSVKKVLGPNGRPTMAFQNHFEELGAIRDGKGIQWTDMLKKHAEIPSYSLVRSSYEWGRWDESLIVHLNKGSSEKPSFVGELPGSYYGSGTHLSDAKGPIRLSRDPAYIQLGEPVRQAYRAAPAFIDVDGDGLADLVTGSGDGSISVHRNLGAQPQLYAQQSAPPGVALPDGFAAAQPLADAAGKPLRPASGTFAAVAAAPQPGGRRADLLIGGADGKIAAARQQPDGKFAPPAPLRGVQVASFAVPAVGDVNGDGVADLVVGDGNGGVTLFPGVPGQPLQFGPGQLLFNIGAKYAAPSIHDVTGDGRPDLVVGSIEGDLLLYAQENGGWIPRGLLQGETTNQVGSKALVGGHNSVPLWYDINHDGSDDLIVGQLEFGIPYNLDDPKFPFKDQLQAFIQHSKENFVPIYPHIYVHGYKTPSQEQAEIDLHKQNFDKLGLPWGLTGTNQHTWRVNNRNPVQTLLSERNNGIWFNFAFRPSHALTDPSLGSEYNWAMPFLLTDPSAAEPMLLHSPSPNLVEHGAGSSDDLYASYTAFDFPIDYFEHIENKDTAYLEREARYFDKLRTENDYNFVTEPQMAQSFLAARTGRVEVSQSWASLLRDKLKSLLSPKGPRLSLSLAADTRPVPQLAGEYKNALGVVVEMGEKYYGSSLVTSSDVYHVRNGKLYVGLAQKADIHIAASKEQTHLVRSNVPYTLHKEKNRWTLELRAQGLQQIKLFSLTPVEAEGPDVQIQHNEADHTYTLTRYGDAAVMTIKFK